MIALNGLNEAYDPFTTAHTARIDDINFALLFGLLRSYEARLNRHTEFKGLATANTVQSSSVVICQICHKEGHSALTCYNHHNEQRFPSKQDKNKNRFWFNRGGKVSSPTVNAVLYPDSRASNHVTSDSDSIQDSEKSSRTLTVANGKSILIIHTRSSSFLLHNKFVQLNDILLAPTINKKFPSVSRFCVDNFVSLHFDKSNVYLKDP